MHKLYLSVLLALPLSVSGMQPHSTFQTVAPEVAGAGGAIAGGAVGLSAMTIKPIALLAFKYGSVGCLAGANALPLLIGGGAFAGYYAAKGTYNWWTAKK
jgi:hypothetical protein